MSSVKGFAALLVGVAVATAVLSSTNIGRSLQGAVNGVAAQVPV
jgi:hypothetical protein